ncbi:MAG: hypothetical protein IKO27_06785 [Ruminococcus sp.]|nr:hypothetical protein [Ruminococcus sp.]
MKEKKLLKQITDNEFKTVSPDLTAADILGASISPRAAVRQGFWKYALAGALTAAIAAAAVFFINRSDIKKDKSAEAIIPPAVSEPVATRSDSSEDTTQPSSSVPDETVPSNDIRDYLNYLDQMRSNPVQFITRSEATQISDQVTWTVDGGSENIGPYRQSIEKAYTVSYNEQGVRDGYLNIDSTPVIELLRLVDLYRNDLNLEITEKTETSNIAPELTGYGIIIEPAAVGRELTDRDIRVTYSLRNYDDENLYIASLRFEKMNGSDKYNSVIWFYVERNSEAVKDIDLLFDDSFTLSPDAPYPYGTDPSNSLMFNGSFAPRLPSAELRETTDHIITDKNLTEFNTMRINCTGSRPEQKAVIDLTVDHENNKLIIDTDICDSRSNGQPITLKGALLEPVLLAGDGTRVIVTNYTADGLKRNPESLEAFHPGLVPDTELTLEADSHIRHHYEITLSGSLSEVNALSLASAYETVVPYWDDSLPEHYGGGLMIRFSQKANSSPS